MGNTVSSEEEEKYKLYIEQQQSMIQQQQQQINSLYQQQQEQQRQQQEKEKKHPELKPKKKLNPYKILGLTKNYDMTSLKKAYFIAAGKTHPDKGGDPESFKNVQISYEVLKKKYEQKNNSHSHEELRSQSKQYIDTQPTMINHNFRENFDSELFNKIYEENKVDTPFDDGYSEWMDHNKVSDKAPDNIFSNGFNQDIFNSEFQKYKSKNCSKQLSTQLEPDVDISFKDKSSLMTLGQGKISDFSGDTNGLMYRDYRDAYVNSNLIDITSVDITKRKKTVGGIENEREKVSYDMNSQDKEYYEMKLQKEEQDEKDRLHRLQQFDSKQFEIHDRLHQRMIMN